MNIGHGIIGLSYVYIYLSQRWQRSRAFGLGGRGLRLQSGKQSKVKAETSVINGSIKYPLACLILIIISRCSRSAHSYSWHSQV